MRTSISIMTSSAAIGELWISTRLSTELKMLTLYRVKGADISKNIL